VGRTQGLHLGFEAEVGFPTRHSSGGSPHIGNELVGKAVLVLW
jgi:hypothetical protein